ncbi:MFS transporter [Fodinicola feengrottensis]|uniref:MFS transporter n=1 Tax=Fodinicola feengrottensis TaxID=435914 RepID=UPI002441A96D|nr:MFS transporter [Fodinicola feengrottensis]
MTGTLSALTPKSVGFGPRFVLATSTGSVLNPINSSIIAVALVSIGQAFGVGADRTAWLVSALYLATAVGQPVMGKLADRFGPRRIYLAGLAMVAAGGLLGAWAGAFGLVIASRVVIGVGTSAAYPAAMTMVRQQSVRLDQPVPGRVLARARAGQVTMAVGPPLGGLLIAAGGWRSIFLVNVPLAVVGAIFALRWLPADEPREPAEAGASGAAAPFAEVRMLVRNRALTATYLRYALTFLVTYSFLYGWTQWLEQSAGLSASAAGLILMPSFLWWPRWFRRSSRAGARCGDHCWWARLCWPSVRPVCFSSTTPPRSGFCSLSAWFSAYVQNAMVVVANQAAMYGQAPAAHIGTAAGLLRTFMYVGAIAAASLISVTYRERATDASLHTLATVLVVASVLVVVMTVLNARTAARR